jgi:hypothetical protein
MTKAEAIQSMKEGNKVTHRFFSPNEWMSSDARGGQYTFEDGVKCSWFEFWQWRTDRYWLDGFSLFNSEQSVKECDTTMPNQG